MATPYTSGSGSEHDTSATDLHEILLLYDELPAFDFGQHDGSVTEHTLSLSRPTSQRPRLSDTIVQSSRSSWSGKTTFTGRLARAVVSNNGAGDRPRSTAPALNIPQKDHFNLKAEANALFLAVATSPMTTSPLLNTSPSFLTNDTSPGSTERSNSTPSPESHRLSLKKAGRDVQDARSSPEVGRVRGVNKLFRRATSRRSRKMQSMRTTDVKHLPTAEDRTDVATKSADGRHKRHMRHLRREEFDLFNLAVVHEMAREGYLDLDLSYVKRDLHLLCSAIALTTSSELVVDSNPSNHTDAHHSVHAAGDHRQAVRFQGYLQYLSEHPPRRNPTAATTQASPRLPEALTVVPNSFLPQLSFLFPDEDCNDDWSPADDELVRYQAILSDRAGQIKSILRKRIAMLDQVGLKLIATKIGHSTMHTITPSTPQSGIRLLESRCSPQAALSEQLERIQDVSEPPEVLDQCFTDDVTEQESTEKRERPSSRAQCVESEPQPKIRQSSPFPTYGGSGHNSSSTFDDELLITAAEKVRHFSMQVRHASYDRYDRLMDIQRIESDSSAAPKRPGSISSQVSQTTMTTYDTGIRASSYGHIIPFLERSRSETCSNRRSSMSSDSNLSMDVPLYRFSEHCVEDPFAPVDDDESMVPGDNRPHVTLEHTSSRLRSLLEVEGKATSESDSMSLSSTETIQLQSVKRKDPSLDMHQTFFDDDDDEFNQFTQKSWYKEHEEELDVTDSLLDDLIDEIYQKLEGNSQNDSNETRSISALSPGSYNGHFPLSTQLDSPTPLSLAQRRRLLRGHLPSLHIPTGCMQSVHSSAEIRSPSRNVNSSTGVSSLNSPEREPESSSEPSSRGGSFLLPPSSSAQTLDRSSLSTSPRTLASYLDGYETPDSATRECLMERLSTIHPTLRHEVAVGLEGSLVDMFPPLFSQRKEGIADQAYKTLMRDLGMLLRLYRGWMVKEHAVLLPVTVLAITLAEEVFSCYCEWYGEEALEDAIDNLETTSQFEMLPQITDWMRQGNLSSGEVVDNMVDLFDRETAKKEMHDDLSNPSMVQRLIGFAGVTLKTKKALLGLGLGEDIHQSDLVRYDSELERMTRAAPMEHLLKSTGLVLCNDEAAELFSPQVTDTHKPSTQKEYRKDISRLRSLLRTAMYESQLEEHVKRERRPLPDWLRMPVRQARALEAKRMKRLRDETSLGDLPAHPGAEGETRWNSVHWTPSKRYRDMVRTHELRMIGEAISREVAV